MCCGQLSINISMADDHKKEEADLKKQIKVLKAGLLEERKKNTQATEDMKALMDKMQKMGEMTNELVRYALGWVE